MIKNKLLLLSTMLSSSLSISQAAVLLAMQNDGSHVRVSISGTLNNPPDFSGMPLPTSWNFSSRGGATPSLIDNGIDFEVTSSLVEMATFLFNDARSTPGGEPTGLFAPVSTVAQLDVLQANPNSLTGGYFALYSNALSVELNGSMVKSGSFLLSNTSLAALGLVEGSSTWALDNGDELTVSVVVPESTTMGLAGFGALTLLVRRRK